MSGPVTQRRDLSTRIQDLADRFAAGLRWWMLPVGLGLVVLGVWLLLEPWQQRQEGVASSAVAVTDYPKLGSLYGLLACLVFVLVARGLGLILQREEGADDAR